MSTVYTCETCNSLLRIGAPLPAGKQLKCPNCAAIYTVPATPETAGVGASAKSSKPLPEDDPMAMTIPLERAPAPSGAPKAHAPSAPGIAPKPAPTPPSSTGTVARPTNKGTPAPGALPKPTGDSAQGKPKPPKSPSGSGAVPQLPPSPPKPAAAPADPAAAKQKSQVTHDGRSQLADLMAAPTATVKLTCPSCQMALKVPENTPGGTSIRCPRCQNKFKPPWSDDAAPKVAPPPALAPAPAPPPAKEAPAAPVMREPAVVRDPSPSRELEFPPASAFTAAEAPATDDSPAPAAPAVAESKPKRKKLRRRQLVWAAGMGGALVLFGLAAGWMWATRDKGPIAAEEWKAFSPPMGHCQISMPGDPVMQRNVNDNGEDLPRSVLYSLQRPDKDATFTLAFVNLPGNMLDLRSFDQMFKNELATMLRTTKEAKLRNESNLEANGHFGREFQIEGAKNSLLIQRVIWVEGMSYSRLYVLQAKVPNNKSGAQSALAFLNSLKLPPRMERTAEK